MPRRHVATIAQGQWEGPNGEAAEQYLGTEARTGTSEQEREAIAQLGLPEGARIRIVGEVAPPQGIYRTDSTERYGATLAWTVVITDARGREQARARVGVLRQPEGQGEGALMLPWPVDGNGNVFADRTGARYVVRTKAMPLPGLYVDEYGVTAAQTEETGSGRVREAGLLAEGNTRSARITLLAQAPHPADGDRRPQEIRELAMQVWPASAPGRGIAQPRTIRGLGRIKRRVRAAGRRRALAPPRAWDAAFEVPAGGSLEADLASLYVDLGWAARPAGDGMMTVRDVDAIATRLGQVQAPDPRLGIRSLANQRLSTALDAVRWKVRESTQEALETVLGVRDQEGRKGVADVVVRVPIPESGYQDDAPQATAEAIAEGLASGRYAAAVERSMGEWRRAARTVRLPPGASEAEVVTVAETVVQTAHRLSRHADDIPDVWNLIPPDMSGLFLDLAGTSHNSQPGRAAPAGGLARMIGTRSGIRVPGLALTASDRREERVVELSQLVGRTIEIHGAQGVERFRDDGPAPDDGQARSFRIMDAAQIAGHMVRQIPLGNHYDGTRLAMASSMGAAALGSADRAIRPVLVATDLGGNAPRATLPTHRLRMAAFEGHPFLFEDGIIMSRSAAQDLALEIHQTMSFARYREGEGRREYVGREAASYEEVVQDIPWLTRESYDKIDVDGLVRPGETLREGDVVQLWRAENVDAETGERRWRYGANRGPAHGEHHVIEVEVSDQNDAVSDDPREAEQRLHDGWAQLADLEAEWGHGLQTARVRTREVVNVDITHKLTTKAGTKGMIHVLDDSQMPCDEDGRPVDVAISGYSMTARMSPGDLRQIRLGHLVESRTARVAAALDAAAAGEAVDEAAMRYAEVLSVDRGEGRRETLAQALGMEPGMDAARAADARRAMEQIEGEQRIGLGIPYGGSREQHQALEASLDYVEGEECTVVYADAAARARGERLGTPGAAGLGDLLILKHLGRKNENVAALDADNSGVHPLTEQRTGSRRLGAMETDAMRAAGAMEAVQDLRTLSDRSAREEAVSDAMEGRPIDSQGLAGGMSRTRETVRHLAQCTGMADRARRSGYEQWQPSGDAARRAASDGALGREALSPAYGADGEAVPGGLADGPRGGPFRMRHIELPVPVLHPRALQNEPGGRTALVPVLLGASARDVAERARRPGGAESIRRALREMEEAIDTRPDSVEGAAAEMNPDDPEGFREAVRRMAAQPGLRPSRWVVETVAVPDARVRGGRQGAGTPAGGAPHRLDTAIRRLVEACVTMRERPDTEGALGQVQRRTDAYFGEVERMLYGKRGLMNRAHESPRLGVAAAGTIMPAPSGQPATHIEVSIRAALAVAGHRAAAALGETEGIEHEEAMARLRGINHRSLEAGQPETLRAWETLRRAAAIAPVVFVRSPALHQHAAWGMELMVRDPRRSPGISPDEDTSVGLHPIVCEGTNADFDGDQGALYPPLSPQAAWDARRRTGPWSHVRKASGEGVQGLPKQAARTGVLWALNHPGPGRSALDALREWAGGDEEVVDVVEQSIAAAPEREQEAWTVPGSGGIEGTTVERLVQRIPAGSHDPQGGAAVRLVGLLWGKGFEACRSAPVNLSLAQYEAFADVWRAAKADGVFEGLEKPAAGTLGRTVSTAERERFERKALERWRKVVESVERWRDAPEAMLAVAARLGMEHKGAVAMPIIEALRGGGRLRPSHVARIACEAGGPSRITRESAGHYVDRGLIEGSRQGDWTMQIGIGAEGKVSNFSNVGKSGFLSFRLSQAMQGRGAVVEQDCEVEVPLQEHTTNGLVSEDARNRLLGHVVVGPEEGIEWPDGRRVAPGDVLDTATLEALAKHPAPCRFTTDPLGREPAHPILEGAMLARPAELKDGTAVPEGTTLDAALLARMEKDEVQVAVRDPVRCQSEGGVCASCCGTLRATGGAPEVGREVGIVAATAISERITQDEISEFHLAGMREAGRIGRRGECEALMTALGNSPRRDRRSSAESDGADPAPGWIADAAREGHLAGGPVARSREVVACIEEIAVHCQKVDPTLMRLAGAALGGYDRPEPDSLDLDQSAARGAGARYCATGRRPHAAAGAAGASLEPEGWETTDGRCARLLEIRDGERSERMQAHRAAAHDDVETLRRMAEQDPDGVRAHDALGRNALHEAVSLEAVQILIAAGCDPLERARHDVREIVPEGVEPWRPNALELLTVKPIAMRGMPGQSAGMRRKRVLETVLSHMRGSEVQEALRADPVLAGALRPRRDEVRARRRQLASHSASARGGREQPRTR